MTTVQGNTDLCHNQDDPFNNTDHAQLIHSFEVYGDGVATVIIGLLGLLGNLITLGIFTRRDLQSTFHTNLCVLAVFDLGYITVALLDSILRIFDDNGILNGSYSDPQSVPNTVWIHLFPTFLWPVSNIFMNSATYMTMAIAIDR